jgi:ADP-ribosyl-[dinitrogen reductase] hydrolase
VLAVAADVDELVVRAAVIAAPGRPLDAVQSGGYVLDTVSSALWCLLGQAGFEESVVTAVGLGKDTTGALTGEHYGLAAIPAAWRKQVQDYDELIAHADRLLDLALGSASGLASHELPDTPESS